MWIESKYACVYDRHTESHKFWTCIRLGYVVQDCISNLTKLDCSTKAIWSWPEMLHDCPCHSHSLVLEKTRFCTQVDHIYAEYEITVLKWRGHIKPVHNKVRNKSCQSLIFVWLYWYQPSATFRQQVPDSRCLPVRRFSCHVKSPTSSMHVFIACLLFLWQLHVRKGIRLLSRLYGSYRCLFSYFTVSL